MESVKNMIYKLVVEQKLSQQQASRILTEINEDKNEDIAIIGMGAKFPDANNIDDYWNNLKEGKNLIGGIPETRKKDVLDMASKVYFGGKSVDEVFTEKEKFESYISKGGYLNEIDKFDANFFRISPLEAVAMEPLQRIFLETTWEVFEDAGYSSDRVYGSNTSVFVGRDHSNESTYKSLEENIDTLTLVGSWTGILAGRVSYILNFKGPCMVLDTACSSGLV